MKALLSAVPLWNCQFSRHTQSAIMIALAVIVGLLATKTQARTDGYICVVEGIYDIDEQGRLETFYRPPEVMTFSVSRVTGEIIGDAVSTERAKSTVVINRGTAIGPSGPPPTSVNGFS